ncbi:hypothetical protein [Undibacterium sp.]|uniref:hypothetical protein n=1 Tax=Undibacterium sp. TaxID=1914977 RepID=UPI002730DC76|nr:hypothetical protein [Undibacterium sp.]MDP1980465.1 hypothetical protein [Undibacterium sp.]
MANIYKVFKDLIPDAPLFVGKVIAARPGHYIIQLPGGAQVTARGQAEINKMVFIKDGVIEGEAPDLTVQIIEV